MTYLSKAKPSKKNLRVNLVIGLLGTASLIATSAQAATVGSEDSEMAASSSKGSDEILVTAQRREQSVMKVPITVTVLSGNDLEERNVDSTLDLQFAVPGLAFTNNIGFGAPFLRGVGTESGHISADPSTAVLVDGVYFGRAGATLQDFLDVERVEVLKGPQGTLYGRNAVSGVIHIISRRPTGDTYAKAEASIGNYNYSQFRGAVGGSLIEGKLNATAAFSKTDHDGFTFNKQLGKDIDDKHAFNSKVALDFTVSDRTNILVRADYMHKNDSEGMAYYEFGVNTGPLLAGGTKSPNSRTVYNNGLQSDPLTHWGGSLEVAHESDAFNFKAISAYRNYDSNMFVDVDGTELTILHLGIHQKTKTFTQEVQLSSAATSSIEWMIGGFYLNDNGTSDRLTLQTSATRRTHFDFDASSYAAFATVGKRFMEDRLGLTVGYRYSSESKNGAILGGRISAIKTDKGTPSFKIDYRIADGQLLYASVSKGVKSASINEASAATAPPEYVTAYEAGLKFNLADGLLTGTASGFYYNYQDLQVQVLNASTGIPTVSSNDATIKGAELGLAFRPSPSIHFDAGFSYLNNRFSKDILLKSPIRPAALPGNQFVLPRSPKFAANVGMEWDFNMGKLGDSSLRLEYSHMGKIFFEQYNQPTAKRDSTDLLNASLRINPTKNWYVDVWAKNLTNAQYVDHIGALNPTNGNLGILADPRTVGFTLGYSY